MLSIGKSIIWQIRVSSYFLGADVSSLVKNVLSRLTTIFCTCEAHSHGGMFDLPTCVSCHSASDEEWMYTVLKNQKLEFMLSLVSGSYSCMQQFRAGFQNPHFIGTCATAYD